MKDRSGGSPGLAFLGRGLLVGLAFLALAMAAPGRAQGYGEQAHIQWPLPYAYDGDSTVTRVEATLYTAGATVVSAEFWLDGNPIGHTGYDIGPTWTWWKDDLSLTRDEHEVYFIARLQSSWGNQFTVDSRATENGQPRRFIVSKLRIKGLTWEDRPNDEKVWDSVAQKEYPSSQHPYHYRLNEDGSQVYSFARPAFYLRAGTPKLEVELHSGGCARPVRLWPEVSVTWQSNYPWVPAASSRPVFSNDKALLTLPPLDDTCRLSTLTSTGSSRSSSVPVRGCRRPISGSRCRRTSSST
jgi:hypothetical protein